MTDLRYASATDTGVVRANNEDQLLIDDADGIFAVADGMGGHAGGEVASLAAVEALRAEFARQPHTVDGLIEAVRQANVAVWERATGDQGLRGMGTTVTVVALVEDHGEEHVAIANVGDSRAYLLRDGELGMLTYDHSVAEQLVREGRLTPEEAAVHPQRHVLTRVLGLGPDVEVDCYPILPYKGDRYLLCSDGLINEVSDDEIASVLRRLADPDEAVSELVGMARAAGGHDNITVVLVDVVDDDDRAGSASVALADETTAAASASGGTLVAETRTEQEAEEEVVPYRTIERPPPPGEVVASKPHRRRVTLRVVLFLLVIVVVLVGVAGAVGFYARGAYYVGLDNGQVTIFKGRPGGLLWFEPTVEQRTGMPEADVPPTRLDDVTSGKEQSSLDAARQYVQNLQAEHDQLTAFSGGTTIPGAPPETTTSTTAATVVP